jgi:hypothetical protein
MLSHEDMFVYYKMNFLLMYLHKFSLTELENMIPFERTVMIAILESHLDEQKKKNEKGFTL